jgi:hypothetical protein
MRRFTDAPPWGCATAQLSPDEWPAPRIPTCPKAEWCGGVDVADDPPELPAGAVVPVAAGAVTVGVEAVVTGLVGDTTGDDAPELCAGRVRVW